MPNVDSFQLPQELLIVGAAVEIGLFDSLKDNPLTLEELSSFTGSDLRALWTVAEALAALNYLEHQDDKIKLTDEAYSVFYDQDNPDYRGFSFMHSYNLLSSWLKLPEVLKTGKPVSKEEKPQERLQYFISAMSCCAKRRAQQIIEHVLKGMSESPRILDVGGGPLTYASLFAQKGAEVTVLDLPEVVDMMMSELDPELNIVMEKGDFTEGLPEGPFELIYLGNVCHIYGEEANRKLFKDAVDELQSGGKLVINDIIRGKNKWAPLFAVNMLVNTSSGGTWTYEQYKTWLQDAGFLTIQYEEVEENQLIIAAK